jgi:hypothetical protein
MALYERIKEREAARQMGIHPETLAEWRRAGLVPHRRAGRHVFYLQEDIDLWFELSKRDAWAATPLKSKIVKLG